MGASVPPGSDSRRSRRAVAAGRAGPTGGGAGRVRRRCRGAAPGPAPRSPAGLRRAPQTPAGAAGPAGRGREGGHAKLSGVRDLAETVDRAFAAALYAQDDAGLDTGASLLVADQAGWPAVGRELLARGEAYVRQGWERGWQPADVLRLVRRDLDERHLRITGDLIAAEARRYARLPARWGADEVWWGGRRARTPTGSRSGNGPTGSRWPPPSWRCYRLLIRLPSIEPVGPLPGTTGHDLAEHAHLEPRMLGRIRALLAKAEATGLPGGGGGPQREGPGADGPAQHRRGPARRAGASRATCPAPAGSGSSRRTRRRRRCSSTPWPRPTGAGRCGTAASGSPRWSASSATWRRWSCSTPRCSCRGRRR